MNIKAALIELANRLDSKGLHQFADDVDSILRESPTLPILSKVSTSANNVDTGSYSYLIRWDTEHMGGDGQGFIISSPEAITVAALASMVVEVLSDYPGENDIRDEWQFLVDGLKTDHNLTFVREASGPETWDSDDNSTLDLQDAMNFANIILNLESRYE